ncbi:MAG: peptidoglycan-binding protein [Gemmatimonadaceae bacterium]|nr:peptidoglycan-binding protein [Gemmatimonadaceae bacterium]
MHTSISSGSRRPILGLLSILATASAAPLNAQRVLLPTGSVFIVRTASPLESSTAQAGQTFETTVEESVVVNEYTVIPARSRIWGTVSLARAATRQQSGVIEVVFNRLVFPDGTGLAIVGKLTSTDSVERRQIERDPNARVVLVGGRGGIGASIAGAGSGRSANNVFAALGNLLSEGRDVSVPAGTPLAVELERDVSLRGRGTARGAEASTIYTAPERIREAQLLLARQNYYRGSATGVLDDATRRALFEFQVDKGLSGTGNLDGRTARALGMSLATGQPGSTLSTVAILSSADASALRRDAQSIVARIRSELGASDVGRLNLERAYSQGDIDLWFAVSAFADNASVYEQLVHNGGNRDAGGLAGRSLVAAARRVDAAMQGARTSGQLQNAWTNVKQRMAVLDTGR